MERVRDRGIKKVKKEIKRKGSVRRMKGESLTRKIKDRMHGMYKLNRGVRYGDKNTEESRKYTERQDARSMPE